MTDSPIWGYPKVYNLGHRELEHLLDGNWVVVQEKVDGSQFSFALLDGQVHFRSKGAVVYPDNPGMFAPAVESVLRVQDKLTPGYVYRGEFLAKPRHNALAYDRVPTGHIALFDVEVSNQAFLEATEALEWHAERLELDVVPGEWMHGDDVTLEFLKEYLERSSFLGGQKVEGVVIKNYFRFGRDGKALMGKYVSEAFKETHKKVWRTTNPNAGDVIHTLVSELCTPARWEKAVMHLAERGELEDEPRDIGKLIKEVQADVLEEERDYITKRLLQWALPKVQRGVVAGLPEWYKARLAERQFEEV